MTYNCWNLDANLDRSPALWVSLNGVLVPATDAKVSAMDRALLYGDAAYTTLKVDGGAAIFLDRHLRRLASHLVRLRFGMSEWGFDLREAVLDLIGANSVRDGLVRITVSRGAAINFPDLTAIRPLIFAFTAGRSTTPKSPVDVITVDDTRDAFRDVKTVNRMVALLSLREARLKGADEALLCMRDVIIEATGNNVFSSQEGILVSPELLGRGMPGIVREVLFENNAVKLAEIDRSTTAPLFLTNSLSGIIPVNSIDGVILNRDESTLQRLQTQLAQAERREATTP